MLIYLNEEIAQLTIDESLIKAIIWSNNFQDITIEIDWCGQEKTSDKLDFTKVTTHLHFDFVTDFKLDLQFNSNSMGALEISSFSFEALGNLWAVKFQFDFYSRGYIKFHCNDLKFVIVPLN